MLTRDQILAAADLPCEDVDVPEWGGTVRVRTFTGADRDAFEAAMGEKGKRRLVNIRARLASLTIVDENGKLVFSEDDIEMLGTKSAGALDRVFAVASRLNGLTAADAKALEGNSVAGQNDSSTSA